MKMAFGRYAIVELIGAVFLCSTVIQTTIQAQAQPNGADIGSLQKEVENPTANLINIQFQNNTNFPIGAFRRVQNVFTLKPVVPFRISENPTITANWKLPPRERWIVPVGPGLGRVFKVKSQSFDMNVTALYNLAQSQHSFYPSWQISTVFALLFPKRTSST
jgi:hypothetical protein